MVSIPCLKRVLEVINLHSTTLDLIKNWYVVCPKCDAIYDYNVRQLAVVYPSLTILMHHDK